MAYSNILNLAPLRDIYLDKAHMKTALASLTSSSLNPALGRAHWAISQATFGKAPSEKRRWHDGHS